MSAPQGAPGWRELCAHRIAQQQQEQATRRNARSRPRRREVEEEETKERQSRKKKGGSTRTTTHLMSEQGVIGATIFVLRGISILLIVASTFGNYIQFVGGWDAYLPIDGTIVGLAVFYQVLCSVFQWGFKAMRWWPLYIVALIASAVPSYLTYSAWMGPYLALKVGTTIALITIAIATIAADALPEWVLVE